MVEMRNARPGLFLGSGVRHAWLHEIILARFLLSILPGLERVHTPFDLGAAATSPYRTHEEDESQSDHALPQHT